MKLSDKGWIIEMAWDRTPFEAIKTQFCFFRT
ncbi:MAG: DUF2805 domain-containing protein [Chitinophagales bacterium]